MKKIVSFLFLILVAVSCETDFLEEANYNLSSEALETEQGLEALLNEGYRKFRYFYGGDEYISAWALTGTDVLYRGRNGLLNNFHRYQGIEATYDQVSNLWKLLYKSLNESNNFIANVDGTYENEELGDSRKGEALFQRAHWLWLITSHFGEATLLTKPSSGAEFEAVRSSRSEFYGQIIEDLTSAIALLPNMPSETGRVGKAAAQAFLSRMYLYIEDYDNAIKMADLVLDNSNYQLEANYADMWNTKENSENNSEFLLAAVFTSDATNTNPRYVQHGWSSQFLALLGHPRPIRDYYGTGLNRMATTRYLVELFDDEIDQRGAVMFGPDPLEIRYSQNNSKVASVFLRHSMTDQERSNYETLQETQGNQFPLVNILDIDSIYNPQGKLREIGTFFDCRKIWSKTRADLGLGPQGVFNHPIIRLAEVYLIKAEAQMMLEDLSGAVNTMNILRRARAVPGQEAAMEVTENDMDIDFILDERARELTHEQQRKFDLIRTGKLAERVQLHNPEATGFDPGRHSLLPIPQEQLDAMTPESAQNYGQNPGY